MYCFCLPPSLQVVSDDPTNSSWIGPATLLTSNQSACKNSRTEDLRSAFSGRRLFQLFPSLSLTNDLERTSALTFISSVALGRSFGSRRKHLSRKSRPSAERLSGMGGGPFEDAMWKSADTCSKWA